MPMNITEVRLCAVPLENDYKHTIYFATQEEQTEYFFHHTVYFGDNFSYQRKDNILRYPKHFDELQTCNYLMYRNGAYSQKWYYAFITKMDYVNDERTDIHFTTDVIQTHFFNYSLRSCFVEREHCRNDEIGENTVDEGLETGEYIAQQREELNYGNDYVIVAGVTETPDGEMASGGQIDGIYSGILYYAFENTISADDLDSFIASYPENGAADAIETLFLAPNILATKTGSLTFGEPIPFSGRPTTLAINHPLLTPEDDYDYTITANFSRSDVDNYFPRNNKLLCYPYRYLNVSNNAGGSVIYKFEKFYTSLLSTKHIIEPAFMVYGCLTPGCSIRMVPLYYNGVDENHDEGINMGKFPILNWTSDIYTNWLTQNGVNIALDIASGLGQVVIGGATLATSGGLAAGVGGSSIVGGVSQIANTLAQIHTQSMVPPQSRGNTNSGDVTTASNDNTFHFYTMSIKREFAEIIDGYFDMFGYKCNKVKIPEKNHRETWWYTKTIDCFVYGDIPMEDKQTIKNCYNNGITFWRNGSRVGDYTQSNNTVEE